MCRIDSTDVEINEEARDGAGPATEDVQDGVWSTTEDARDGARPATEDALALPIDRYTVRANEALVARRSQDGQ